MNPTSALSPEVQSLMEAVCDGIANDAQVRDLQSLLRTSDEICRSYVELLHLDAELQWLIVSQQGGEVALGELAAAERTSQRLSPTGAPGLFHTTVGYISSGWPVAYLIATVIVGIGLVIGAVTRVSRYEEVADDVPPAAAGHRITSQPRAEIVGRITGMVDCKWAKGSVPRASNGDLSPGRELRIESGLVEITYGTGATVLLQGPVTYVVESKNGGFMSVGKLTGKVATDDAKGFLVRTPTATVTDLGTEFGVEVDRSGETTSHVFRGSVQVQLTSRSGPVEGAARVLHEDESVRVSTDGQEKPTFVSVVSDARTFVRRLPGRVPIKLFSTGVGLKERQPDPHWQVVAVSNDPSFKPRPAVVAKAVEGLWMPNAPKRSQWISAAGDPAPMPNGVTYTFRTTFELGDVRPETARLRGWFAVDNHIRAMRLNGRAVDVARHEYDRFNFAHAVSITAGFVEGMNVLEVDVENVPQPAGFPNRAAADSGPTNLFRDDFETAIAASTRNYPDDSGDYDPTGANPGKWTINENDPNAVQVTRSNVPPDPGAHRGTKCLRLRRAVDGKDVAFAEAMFSEQTTVGDRLHISAMVYVPAVEQATDVAMQVTVGCLDGNYINLMANFDGHRSIVSHTRDGVSHDTGVDFIAGRWQRWEIDYAIGAKTCSIRIGDRRATGVPVDPVTFVDRVAYWGHFNASSPVYIDDVLVQSEAGPMGLRVELGGTVQQK